MRVYLETERLILRQLTADDLEALVALDGDPAVMRYLGGEPTPRDEIAGVILPHWLGYYRRGERYGFWAAIERESGAFLGWFHFRPSRGAGDDEPELGYRLRRSAWGQGYGTEGSRALIEKGFREFGVRRVVASTDIENRASRRVMEKCGMTVTGYFVYAPDQPGSRDPAPDRDDDSVEYALERADWARMGMRTGMGNAE